MALIEPVAGMAAPLRQVVEASTELDADVTVSEGTEEDLRDLYSFKWWRWSVPDSDREAALRV